LPSRLTTRIARLEQACRDELIQNERERNIAKLHVLTPAERRERMKILAGRIVRDRAIELAPGESVLHAAVRSLSHLRYAGDQLNDD
jgi:hypothetical protein